MNEEHAGRKPAASRIPAYTWKWLQWQGVEIGACEFTPLNHKPPGQSEN